MHYVAVHISGISGWDSCNLVFLFPLYCLLSGQSLVGIRNLHSPYFACENGASREKRIEHCNDKSKIPINIRQNSTLINVLKVLE